MRIKFEINPGYPVILVSKRKRKSINVLKQSIRLGRSPRDRQND